MSGNIRSTNLRFNLDKPLQREAWEYLQKMDKNAFKSYSNTIAVSLVNYFERYYRKQDDPYLETREREERFVEQLVEAVEKATEKTLPGFLAACLAGLMHPYQPQKAISPQPGNPTVNCVSTKEQAVCENVDWDFLGE